MRDIETTYGKAEFIEAGGNTGADIQLSRIEIFDHAKGNGMAYDLLAEVDAACRDNNIELIEAYIMPDEDNGNIDFDSLLNLMEGCGWERFDDTMVVKYY